MADIADLERRVIALEAAQGENTKTLHWVVGTLGRVASDVAALKLDVVTLRADMGGMERRLTTDIANLRRDLPGIVGDAVREAMGGSKP